MFAVLEGTIQHFPAENLPYYINGNFDFYTDNGEKIEKENLNEKAEEEIKEHTVDDSDSAIKCFRAGQKDDAVIPYRIFGIGKVNSNPLENITGSDNNGGNN